jgi:hypothetical protein
VFWRRRAHREPDCERRISVPWSTSLLSVRSFLIWVTYMKSLCQLSCRLSTENVR